MIGLLILAIVAAADVTGQTRAENLAAAAALHRRLDTNHDGYVTYAELRAVALAVVVPTGQAIDPTIVPDSPAARVAFAAADTDGDGRLSIEEDLVAADRAFAAADTNHDGVLSAAERAAYAVQSLARTEAELRALKPLPCRAGAACSGK